MLKWICLVVLGVWVVASPAHATESIPRTVLAIYDDRRFPDHFFTSIHQHAEVWLNHLGLIVRYHPLSRPLPRAAELEDVRGILTWFAGRDVVADGAAYCAWLDAQATRGRRIVILEEPGVMLPGTRRMSPACVQLLHRLGADYDDEFSDNPFFWDVVTKDSAMVEFERRLDLTEPLTYNRYRAASAATTSYLTVRRRDLADSDAALVFTSPAGGFVHAGYALYEDTELKRMQWRLHPGRFFAAALDLHGLPRPDVTTVNGRRIFYSHIDGDGIFNVSHLDGQSYAGEVILREIVRRFADVPITASLITGYFTLANYQGPRITALYHELLALPNVEVAAHGFAHPNHWGKRTLALQIPGYQFDVATETVGSVERLRELLQTLRIDKPVRLYQWTGNCLPDEATLTAAASAIPLTLNGGDSRIDRWHPSTAYLFPIGIERGGARQIYTSMPNENVFTNLWSGPYYGYRDVLETFTRTETPIRLKPLNIYYHYYSGERESSVAALRQVYDQALREEIFPLWASQYTALANDFYRVRMERQGDGFVLHDLGTLRTVRFDDEPRSVDFTRSHGVLGFRHVAGSLYVTLDAIAAAPFIALTPTQPTRAYLEQANLEIRDWHADAVQVRFAKQGWGRGIVVLAGMTPQRRYRIQRGSSEQTVDADATGRLTLHFPVATSFRRSETVHIDATQ
ncbi:MAG: hypothetical protein HY696_02095 [Deltaproteobacteria bacterium]|nr:hypothetical protein [Deltaproteobacteria bacterium]